MMPRSLVFTHQTRYKLGSVNDSRTVHWTGSHTRFRTVPAGVNSWLLVGDFNYPDINLAALTGFTMSSKLFCDCVFDNNLF